MLRKFGSSVAQHVQLCCTNSASMLHNSCNNAAQLLQQNGKKRATALHDSGSTVALIQNYWFPAKSDELVLAQVYSQYNFLHFSRMAFIISSTVLNCFPFKS